MKRILLSLVVLVLAGTAAVGATRAYFSDTETSTDNTLASGTLDLKVDDKEDANVVHVTLSDMKPGQTASYNWTLSNSGSLSGKPWVEITNLRNYDNGCNDPEEETPDTTCGDPGLGDGELGANLLMKLNAPGSVGYVYPNHASCVGGNQCPLNYWNSLGHIDEVVDGQVWDTIAASSTLAGPMVLEFVVPSTTGNIIQSDSVKFDLVFHLEQVNP